MEFDRLPEECISKILSLTTPLDVCRCSSVSTSFKSAAQSDLLWQNFLPSDYNDVLSIHPLCFSSKKQLFLHLCNPIFIDHGRKSLKIEKSSGRKSYMLSARDLHICWSDQPMYWTWLSLPDSRFNEVARLRTTWWLEIQGKINTKMLSRNTRYGAYIVFKVTENAYGLDIIPCEVSIEVGNQIRSRSCAYLCTNKHKMQKLLYKNRMEMLESRLINGDEVRVPRKREDELWMEIELGDFFVNGEIDEEEEVKMNLKEVKGQHLKGGLVIEGIEVRPKHLGLYINFKM
ncbi:F-box protein VBF-like [Euphorbia lathyris]|uniref:F-box protein VBF-like n=1 Tax=Euphorbia lathyris TaxID=212925 RepID=UPI0033141C97